jgi:uncharacterized membrane protein YhaH (DUF805 family)
MQEEGMTSIARMAHLASAWLYAAGVLLQGYLAGSALAQLGGSGDFGAHTEVGYTLMGLLALAVPLLALLGRYPRAHVGWSALLLVLYVVQTTLPSTRDSSPAIAALHPVNAMIMLVLAVAIAVNARRIQTASSVA